MIRLSTLKVLLRSIEVPVLDHLLGRLLREQLQMLPPPLLSLLLVVTRRP